MFVNRHILILLILSFAFEVSARKPPKVHHAVRVNADVKIDGKLDDPAWEKAPVAKDFFQLEPNPGEPASFDTHVKIIYDDEAIYIGALMYDPEPEKILRQLSARDKRENSAWFGVAIDPYRNYQLGFSFNVTSAGVQQDILLSNQGEDLNWNAVWESEVSFTDEGWIAELKIPYSAIRFPQTEVQSWGFQLTREIRRTRENSYWNEVVPTVDGFMTQFGQLEGIKDIEPPVRLSFTPFMIAYADVASPKGQASTNELYYNAGMDVKYGINDAFTLDMTLIPDFGQVQSDNTVLNLSPFEVFFEENRQFFTEGIELFEKGGLFYSRRIGGSPINRRSVDLNLQEGERIVEDPSVTRLYNASKVSGRTKGGLGIGVLNAIGAPTDLLIENSEGGQRKVNVSPLTNYNVLVFDQSLRANSSITFTNTSVMRSGSTYDANVSGLAIDIKNPSQSYAIQGAWNVSQIYGEEVDLEHAAYLELGKISGNLQGSISYTEESADYNINDLGFLFAPNERTSGFRVTYNEYKPKNEKIQLYRFGFENNYDRLYNPNVFVNYDIGVDAFVLFKSRDAFGGSISVDPVVTYDYFEPRTPDFSSRMAFPTSVFMSGFISSDYRKPLALDSRISYRKFDEAGRSNFTFRFAPRIRFSDQVFMIVEGGYDKFLNDVGYVNRNFASELQEVPADQILFGVRDRQRIQTIANIDFTFNEVMSLTTRVRHYWDRVVYDDFGWLKEDGFLEKNEFTGRDESNRAIFDRNINLFNVDMVYTWRFAPGSDIIIVWKNQISQSDQNFDGNYLDNLNSLGDANQFDSFSFKLIYFLDYLYLKR